MAETKFYTEQFRVMDCDCDMNHRLTAGAFLRLAQQISTDQCESIGMNDDFYRQNHAVFLLASMFLLGGVMARLPLAALAGVLMVTAWRMNDWEGIRYLLGHRFKSGISQFFITMVATVAADLTVAILVGIVYSALLYIVKASHINVSFSDIDASRLPGAPGGALPKAGGGLCDRLAVLRRGG